MYLTIDIGNTFHKAGIFSQSGELLHYSQYENITIPDIQNLFEQYPILYSILSSVAKDTIDLEMFLSQHSQFIRFGHQTPLPIHIQYGTPETLGLDRLANAVAASFLYPGENILSIQAGTCIVYDFITKENIYLGGAISPGIEMRFKSLNHFTKRLPLHTKSDIDFFIGQSTQQSIESGVINGVKFEIEGFISEYTKKHTALKILLTGGDGAYLQKSIKNTIFAGSNFILQGLYQILRTNAEAN